MYEIQLEEGEIINYNKSVRIEVDGVVKHVGLVVTNLYLMIFEDVQKRMQFKEIMRIAKGANFLPRYELIFKEALGNLQGSYEEGNTIIKVSDKTICVIGEQIPLPIIH